MSDRVMMYSPMKMKWCEGGIVLPRDVRQTEIMTALYKF